MAIETPILVLSEREAKHYLRASPVAYLISIGDVKSKPPRWTGCANVLRLVFDDISTRSNGAGYQGAQEEDIQKIITMAQAVAANPGVVLIHCAAGISRSTAAAIILLATIFGDGHEEAAVQYFLSQIQLAMAQGHRLKGFVHPNPWMLALGDGILQRQGRLLQAVDKLVQSSMP